MFCNRFHCSTLNPLKTNPGIYPTFYPMSLASCLAQNRCWTKKEWEVTGGHVPFREREREILIMRISPERAMLDRYRDLWLPDKDVVEGTPTWSRRLTQTAFRTFFGLDLRFKDTLRPSRPSTTSLKRDTQKSWSWDFAIPQWCFSKKRDGFHLWEMK